MQEHRSSSPLMHLLINGDEMKLRCSNSTPVTSTYWPSLDVPNVAYQSKPLKMKFGQLCFMESLMYLKLREPKLNLLYVVKPQLPQFMKPSSIFVIFEDLNFVQDPRTFQFRSPRVPKIKLITLNFQPLFGSVVVYCHMDGSILRQRTRGLEESTIQYSFSLGSWEKSQHMNSFL